MLAPGTAYVIPARVGVWLPGGCFLGSDVRLRFVVLLFCSVLFCFVLFCRSPLGVGVFRGTFPGTGTTRMRSPHRDLQNVPENLGAKPPNIAKTKAIAPKSTFWETITWETFRPKYACG